MTRDEIVDYIKWCKTTWEYHAINELSYESRMINYYGYIAADFIFNNITATKWYEESVIDD